MHENIINRLRVDPGQLTLGQLLQDREAALQEILRLRKGGLPQITRKDIGCAEENTRSTHQLLPVSNVAILLRLTEVCELLGVSRSTVYKWLAEGSFPVPVRLTGKSIRWRRSDLELWCDRLEATKSSLVR